MATFKKLVFSPQNSPVERATLLNLLVRYIDNVAKAVPSPAILVATEQAFGQSPDVGISTFYAREDHTHGTPELAIPDGFITEPMTDGTFVTDSELQPIRLELEKLRLIMLQLVKLELGDQPDRGWEGLNG